MELNARTDVQAPQQAVFAAATDFAGFERQALRRNIDVTRTNELAVPGIGSGWTLKFDYRGRRRVVHARITAFDPPHGYTIEGKTDGLVLQVPVELIPMARANTRLALAVHFGSTTMASRLMVRSLWLVRRTLNRRIAARLEHFRKDIEQRQGQPD